jgi:hypothetical protein
MAGLDPVAVSTALTIGPVIFGPVGDDTRLESTVIGKPVNLAAKLDKHNKKLGTRALATQDAFAMALAQGYYPKAPRETRCARRVDDSYSLCRAAFQRSISARALVERGGRVRRVGRRRLGATPNVAIMPSPRNLSFEPPYFWMIGISRA